MNNKEWLFNCLSIAFNNQFEWYGDKFPDKNIIYDVLIDFYVDFLKIDKDNLIKFINRFGYVSLRYLESNNIKAVINLGSKKFDLFINLFREDNLKLDNDTYNTVINAILQREFMVQCSDDYNILSPAGFISSMFAKPTRGVGKRCKTCGTSENEFLKTGYLGCSDCYDTFSDSVDVVVRKVQGNTAHIGRTPTPVNVPKSELETLKDELATAVKKEDYKLAAKLRDKIKSMEGGI